MCKAGSTASVWAFSGHAARQGPPGEQIAKHCGGMQGMAGDKPHRGILGVEGVEGVE